MPDIARLPGALATQWEWQSRAACRGMEPAKFFHPAKERDAAREERIAAAKAICRGCPVISQCLDHSLRVREPYGIWGGLSERERANLLGQPITALPRAHG